MQKLMEDNRNYCTKEKMKIDDKIVFKRCLVMINYSESQPKGKKKAITHGISPCFSDFFIHKLQDTESRKIVIIKSRMTQAS